MTDFYIQIWLEPFFDARQELKMELEKLLANLEEGGCYEEAEKIKKMNWNELMKFKDL